MSEMKTDWLTVRQGKAPLIVSFPHTGTDLPDRFLHEFDSPWLASKDTDWWIDRLYDFVTDLDATIIHTAISRSIIDVNRDPSGDSLYPGQATTDLVPVTTFDGEALYADGREKIADGDRATRYAQFFAPYHTALAAEIARLRALHAHVVLYDCHSIRSIIPRLFAGELPHLNLGTNGGASCDPRIENAISQSCRRTTFDFVANGRFQGGWITRRYGEPARGVHAVQMELACRGYMTEPKGPVSADCWPSPYDPIYANPLRASLMDIFDVCVATLASLNKL
jgi:N-formylglutamate deformylase